MKHIDTSAAARLDLGKLVKPSRHAVGIPLEIETRYLMPAKLAHEVIRDKRSALITTHYFTSDAIPSLIRQHGVREAENDHHLLTTARIRKIAGASTEYHLDFKGLKRDLGDGILARPELPPIFLTKKQYESHRRSASGGATLKRRFFIPGTVFTKKDESVHLEAHLDHFLRAGRDLEKIPKDLFTIEFESSFEVLSSIQKGHHDFAFIKHCLELNDCSGELAGLLANRRLARKGYDKRLRHALQSAFDSLR